MNALTAFAMVFSQGIEVEQIRKSFQTFKGIKRRFSYQIKTDNFVYVDDYAHHPTEIQAVHDALRELYPNHKITAVFQPHLFSRTQDFAIGFAEQLSRFDKVFLLEIYPARELPVEGVNSTWLMSLMGSVDKSLISKEMLIPALLTSDNSVLVTIGAGDIGECVSEIKNAFEAKISLTKSLQE
jgi:UDP-N-acetylmuramate--alanine ligase